MNQRFAMTKAKKRGTMPWLFWALTGPWSYHEPGREALPTAVGESARTRRRRPGAFLPHPAARRRCVMECALRLLIAVFARGLHILSSRLVPDSQEVPV